VNYYGRVKVLIVEDEPLVARYASAALEEKGFSPTWTASGTHALDLLATTAIAVSFIDIGLPDIRGDDLVRTLRQMDSSHPILICTGFDAAKYRAMFAADALIRVLQKPFTQLELLAGLYSLGIQASA
ncbi:MAG: response regulator, partial [Povalibacter sp.]